MKNKYVMTLIGAFGLLLAVSIAYAALSTTLTITANKVTQQALTWNVALVTGTLTATEEGTASGRVCGTATVTTTNITVANTTLSKPGDGCVYTFQVRNSGDIAAKLGTITPTKPTGTGVTCATASGGNMVCGNITYKITTNSTGTTVATSSNTTVNAGQTKTLYLVVRYTGTSLSSSTIEQSSASFSMPFNQA